VTALGKPCGKTITEGDKFRKPGKHLHPPVRSESAHDTVQYTVNNREMMPRAGNIELFGIFREFTEVYVNRWIRSDTNAILNQEQTAKANWNGT
jgi:hypothetical protein